MAQIYQTKNFIVEAAEKPLVTRTDGGHIRILIKDIAITDRTKLSPAAAIELMRLTMIVGEAMEKSLNNRGIKVVKINYQDMGNWAYKIGDKPVLHVHIFGRAQDAKHQPFPESVYLPDRSTGFYDKFEPLNNEDILEIQKQIEIIGKQSKYKIEKWGI
ncbi:MAG: HIT domain-containing protein [Patescibacteria group bacterium]|nr:HIT domain-containing protein [Patescibacteria group bacterium]